jgi:hypothetical protein
MVIISKTQGLGISCEIQIKGDVLHIIGEINEFVDLKPYHGPNHPDKINLRGVKLINSIGINRFFEFAMAWGNRKIQLLECSQVIIDAINIFPGLLGDPPVPSRVRSVVLPYYCNLCGKGQEFLIDVAALDISKPESLPAPTCCEKMELDGLFEDFFLFLECDD